MFGGGDGRVKHTLAGEGFGMLIGERGGEGQDGKSQYAKERE